MEILGLAAVVAGVFAIIMLVMAVGVIFSNRPLRGSCGGPAVLDDAGNPMTCPDCNCKTEVDIGPGPAAAITD
ncbi:MAG: hypothetical protein GKS06_09005 [Acidobacteria bacterium]|nr:hypothetical protein [Acidobacteriota bacterium]